MPRSRTRRARAARSRWRCWCRCPLARGSPKRQGGGQACPRLRLGLRRQRQHGRLATLAARPAPPIHFHQVAGGQQSAAGVARSMAAHARAVGQLDDGTGAALGRIQQRRAQLTIRSARSSSSCALKHDQFAAGSAHPEILGTTRRCTRQAVAPRSSAGRCVGACGLRAGAKKPARGGLGGGWHRAAALARRVLDASRLAAQVSAFPKDGPKGPRAAPTGDPPHHKLTLARCA
jgi:hypothetical protein